MRFFLIGCAVAGLVLTVKWVRFMLDDEWPW